jgi:hypothetical protein
MRPSDLDFETWEELFDYILESKLNGQRKQSLEIFKGMPEQKRVEFADYLYDMYIYDSMHYSQQKLLAQTIKFYQI